MSTSIRSGGTKAAAHGGAAAATNGGSFNGSAARMAAILAVTNFKPLSPPLNFADMPAREIFGANSSSKSFMERSVTDDLWPLAHLPGNPVHQITKCVARL